jgi:hypothetical protein
MDLSYERREAAKRTARYGTPEACRTLLREALPGLDARLSDRAVRPALIMAMHFHRQSACRDFHDYAQHWIAAQRGELLDDSAVLNELEGHWRQPAVLRITRGESYFN